MTYFKKLHAGQNHSADVFIQTSGKLPREVYVTQVEFNTTEVALLGLRLFCSKKYCYFKN